MSIDQPKFEQQETKGKNVDIVLKFIRHGERDGERLIDLGREITEQRADESGLEGKDFGAVKAIGSNAGALKSTLGIGRSLETAHIYAHEIAGDEQFRTRINDVLNYETLLSPRPYDHLKVYNSYLPENFKELTGQDRVAAAKKAQTAVVNHLVGLDSPEALTYKKEIAGSFAHIVKHYEQMTSYLKPDSKVLIVAGTHGGTMEFLLQQALIMEKDGKQQTGFTDIADIGGEFDPSEAYNVDIATDDQGKINNIKVTFDNPKRPSGEMFLDMDKIDDLSAFYEKLHKSK